MAKRRSSDETPLDQVVRRKTTRRRRRKPGAETTSTLRAKSPAEAASERSGEHTESTNERPTARAGQYLTFFLRGEEYAAEILQVREIIEFRDLTTVPTTPTWIRGVINLRGSVVPVVDLAAKFGLPATEITKRSCVVIVDVELDGDATVMGVMVDRVNQVIDLVDEEIEPAPSFGTRIRTDCLLGMGKPGERIVLLLDVDRVLGVGELVSVSALEAPNGGATAGDEGAIVAGLDAGDASPAGRD